MKGKRKSNISIFPKPAKINLNVGVVVFLAIFCYLIIVLIMFLSQKHVAVYEVRNGSIYNNYFFNGFIVRNEDTHRSGSAGHINYLVHEGGKVGIHTPVYAISGNPLKLEEISSENETRELSAQDKYVLFQKINSFVENYDPQNYFDIYSLKDSFDNTLENSANSNKKNQLQAIIDSGTENVNLFYAGGDGIISFIVDGYEDTTVETYIDNPLTPSDYAPRKLEDDSSVSENENIYKLISGNQWHIVFPIDEKHMELFRDVQMVKVKFVSDQQMDRAEMSVVSRNGRFFAVLTLNSSMVRYEKNRFIDIELIMEDQTGLKIPKSSLVSKECYPIDPIFLTHKESSNEKFVTASNEKGEIVESGRGICFDRENNAFLDSDIYPKGTVLVSPDGDKTLALSSTREISGVYVVNKGYTVFTNVNILAENEEYYIVEEGSGYALSNYDHIVLDSDNVTDSEIVFN